MSSDRNLISAHRHSSRHRDEIQRSERCGCFYCLEIFPPGQIIKWIDTTDSSDAGQTALCPHCGIDAVVGSASGLPMTPTFLREMHDYWFGADVPAQSIADRPTKSGT